jgi:hypothetical protein
MGPEAPSAAPVRRIGDTLMDRECVLNETPATAMPSIAWPLVVGWMLRLIGRRGGVATPSRPLQIRLSLRLVLALKRDA